MAFDDLLNGIMPAAFGGQRAAMQPMQQLRAMSYINRDSRMGVPRQGRMSDPRQGAFSLPGQETDFSQFTYDPQSREMATQALSPYGVRPLAPQEVNPNALLPNSGFFGNHPGLSRALEGGMFGAAATQGADTWGQGISNIAQGLINGQSERNTLINRQFERPFQTAAAVQHLKGLALDDNLHEAMIQHYRAESQHLGAMDQLGQDKLSLQEQLGNDKINATRPVPTAEGSWVYGPGGWEMREGQGTKPISQGGGGLHGEIIRGTLGPPPAPGTPAAKKYWAKAGQLESHLVGQDAYTRSYNNTQAGLDQGTKQTNSEKYTQRMQQYVTNVDKTNPAFWALQGIDLKDEKAKQQWYMNNFPDPDGNSPTPAGAPASDPFQDLMNAMQQGNKPKPQAKGKTQAQINIPQPFPQPMQANHSNQINEPFPHF